MGSLHATLASVLMVYSQRLMFLVKRSENVNNLCFINNGSVVVGVVHSQRWAFLTCSSHSYSILTKVSLSNI